MLDSFPSITPNYTFTKSPMFETVIFPYRNKYEQRWSKRSSPRYRFTLNFTSLRESALDSIHDFYISRKGRMYPFQWTNPEDSVTYIVKFEEDLINQEYFEYKLYRLGKVTFIEVAAASVGATIADPNFGTQSVPGTYYDSTTVYNYGTLGMQVSAISWTSGSSAFSYNNSPVIPFTVSACGTKSIQFKWSPTVTGYQSATFQLTCTDMDDQIVTFTVSGSGT